ncbi:hypothetical protein KAU32_12615 [bacterium]|nr:hypothetical protein [bacterium]
MKRIILVFVVLVSVLLYASQITVAVLNFKANTGDEERDAALIYATTDIIISDLTDMKELLVIEIASINEIHCDGKDENGNYVVP